MTKTQGKDAEKKGSQTAIEPYAKGGKLALPDDFYEHGVLLDDAGCSPEDLLMTVHCYAGTEQEDAKWDRSKLKRGMFVDRNDGSPIGEELTFMPLLLAVSYMRWDKDDERPKYHYMNREQVPAEDLTWGADNEPPACMELGHVAMVLEQFPLPAMFTFKKTAAPAFDVLRKSEYRRKICKQPPGLWKLCTKADTSADNKPYRRVIVQAQGDPPEWAIVKFREFWPQIQRVREEMIKRAAEEAPAPDPSEADAG